MWPSLGQAQDSKCSKTVEVWCGCQELKPCPSEITADEIKEKIKSIQSAEIYKRVLQCTDWLSVKQNSLWAAESFRLSAQCKNLTHIAQLTTTCLNH